MTCVRQRLVNANLRFLFYFSINYSALISAIFEGDPRVVGEN